MLNANIIHQIQSKTETVLNSKIFYIPAILGGGSFSITAFVDLIQGPLAVAGVVCTILASIALFRLNNAKRKLAEFELEQRKRAAGIYKSTETSPTNE